MALHLFRTPASDGLRFILHVQLCASSSSPTDASSKTLLLEMDLLNDTDTIPTWFPFERFFRDLLANKSRDLITTALDQLHVLSDHNRMDLLRAASVLEKTSGDIPAAMRHIQSVALMEGGLVVASPLTLLNLSACMLAQNRIAEAAALARQSVSRLIISTPPHITAAAFHNLATAMEAAQDLEAADIAFRRAEDVCMMSLGDTHMTTVSVQRSYASFLCRTHYTNAALQRREWEMTSKESLVSHTRKVMQKSIARAQPNAVVKGKQQAQLPPSVAVYHLPPLSKITTMKGRKSLPEWNGDPLVGLASRPLPRVATIDSEIEEHVSKRYIPKWLVPAMEDLLYKQSTRRNALIVEERVASQAAIKILSLYKLCALEKEVRVMTEASEYRNRRQMMSWTYGKVIFLDGRRHLTRELDAFRKATTAKEERSIAPLRFEIGCLEMGYYEPHGRDAIGREEASTRARTATAYKHATGIFFTGLGLEVEGQLRTKSPMTTTATHTATFAVDLLDSKNRPLVGLVAMLVKK